MEPTPLRPRRHEAEFLLGLALGAVPLAIWLVFIGAAAVEAAPCRSGQIYCWFPGANQLLNGLTVYGLLWLTQMIATLAILANGARRFLGYGLLVMLLVGPIVGAIACINYQALPVAGAHLRSRAFHWSFHGGNPHVDATIDLR